MPWLRWLPWRFLVGRAAKAHGFLDPVALVARLHQFAQPSEVAVPLELLRAAVVFHARGLVNSRVIQHNLDWVWPYWIERQFNPNDAAFIPRAFSISHVNLTHRNWTAVGLPDVDELPIVDPRGLLTPILDGWSLDCWIVTHDGRALLPSRAAGVLQWLDLNELAVVTEAAQAGFALRCQAGCEASGSEVRCVLAVNARVDAPGWLVVSLRPCNPEGVSFVQRVRLGPDRRGWTIDDRHQVTFSAAADRHHVSNYRGGDVYIRLRERTEEAAGSCEVGMATAAAMFALEPDQPREIKVEVPLAAGKPPARWADCLRDHCRLQIPDERLQALYDVALHTLVLHSPADVYPGPYTYKRFWFRDAAFILHALLCAGLIGRAERALDRFPARQNARGYFHSQDGEWDSNGEALWIFKRFCELTGRQPKAGWLEPIRKAAHWIRNKRVREPGLPHSGLLPAGFSAEHLGPNDYYYWDDFWGVAGLRAAADMLEPTDEAFAGILRGDSDAFEAAVIASLETAEQRLGRPAMPASPYRRLDAGAIGSLVAGYPLKLWAATDRRLLDTAEFLLANCFVGDGFFQDMVHSGINPYLTLHVAQVLLRAHDPRYRVLMRKVASLASPTGQWPEAIHPRTRGGCMGDGQHVWAAAEWVILLRHCFVCEEGGRLILCSGLLPEWLCAGNRLMFGPAPTSFGAVTVTVEVDANELRVHCEGDWHAEAPPTEILLEGRPPVPCLPGQRSLPIPIEVSP